MAGVFYQYTTTFRINDAGGVTKFRFVEGVADDDSGNLMEIQMPSGDNVDCIGISAETGSDEDTIGVITQDGYIFWVQGDGTAVVGDDVYNDSDGKATPVPSTGTAGTFYAMGKVVEVQADDMLKVMLQKRIITKT